MAKKREAIPNPEMVAWARKSSAMPLEIAAAKLRIDPQRLNDWETGEDRPTLPQLRKLGVLYRRPLAAFYYPKPPKLPPRLRDLRLLPALADELDWIDLTMEARTARERRAMVLELLRLQDQSPPPFPHRARLNEDPEDVAQRVRGILGVSLEQQTDLKTADRAFAFWRNVVGRVGVLVFQMANVSVKTARGFSIAEFPLPAIVVNRKDTPRARVFTVIHEFLHVMLRIGGVCDMDYRDWRPPTEQRIEVFCNHVAGAVLVPKEALMSLSVVQQNKTDGDWTDDAVARVAAVFGVSREVVLRRLLILGQVSAALYQQKRDEFLKEYEKLDKARKQQGGFLPPADDVVSSAGRPYVSLVLNALHNDLITRSDASDYLRVRLKHLPKIQDLAGRR